MALIGVLVSFTPLTTIKSADVNTNFSAIQTAFNTSAVLTDTIKTVGVSHIWTASQTFTGGFTTGAAVSLGGALNFGTDNTYDIGASAASRPRNVYIGGTLTAAGAAVLGSTLNVTGASVLAALNSTNLTVSGASALTGLLTLSSGLAVSGPITIPTVGFASNVPFSSDNSYDIGQSASSRPRNVYVGTKVTTGQLVANGALAQIVAQNSTASSYATIRLYNDMNLGTRALELDYSGSAYGGALLTGGPTGETAAIYTTGAFPLSFGANATELLRLGANGGVSAYGPANVTALQAYGSAVAGQSYGLYVQAGTNSSDQALLVNNRSGTSLFRVRGDGASIFRGNILCEVDNSFTIGQASNLRPSTIYCAWTIFSASSRALKQDIKVSRVDALSVIRQTRIVDYRYKANPEVQNIGFIAEDTPELLSGKSRKEFNLNNAVGLLLKAVQELETKLGKLERRLEWARA